MLGLLRCCRIRVQTFTKVAQHKYMTISPTAEGMLKKMDNVPKHFELIYRETSYKGGGAMYHAINFTTCLAIGVYGYMWYKGEYLFSVDEDDPFVTQEWQKYGAVFGLAYIYFIAFITRRRYVIRIYRSQEEKKYKAVFIGKIPFTVEKYEFPENSLSFVSKDSILFWRKSLFNHDNKRKILLYEDKFKTPVDFHEMLKPHELEK